MHGSRHALWAAVTAAVVFGLFAPLAQTAATATTSQGAASLTIRLISITGPIKVVTDRAPKGRPSKGDVFAVRSVLRNAVRQFGRAKGAVVGHDYAVLTFTSPTTGIEKVAAHLPGGTIRLRGHVNFKTNPHSGTLPVVGGTGRYVHARGTAYVRDLSQTRSVNVYHLRIP